MLENRWEGIDEFVAVAECGQFTAAAERLGVSSSHISRQVARLEERLQTRLFYRSTRRVTLTEAGQTFLQHCQRLQDGREEALRAVGDLTSEPKGYAAHDLRRGLWRTFYRAVGNTLYGACTRNCGWILN
jgi:DNA-binding transcriptional LysR family regulator